MADLPWLLPILAAPFIGSFLGVLVRRLPEGRPIAWSRSACEACGQTLGPAELVPIASFLIQRGRCRRCHEAIAWFHPAIELACLAIAIIVVSVVDGTGAIWSGCGLGWALLALAWIDWEHLRLPDALTLPLLLAGLAATAWLQPDQLTSHAIGAALGYAGFRLIAALHRKLRGFEGLGAGDAKLLASGGAWVGWQALPGVILYAAVAGLLAALTMRAVGVRVSGGVQLPFGPWLALAIWLVWLLGAPDTVWP